MTKKNKISFITILKILIKTLWKYKKTTLIAIVLICSFGTYQYIEYIKKEEAISSCEKMYKDKLNTFAEKTGITADNVYFNDPKITKSKGLYKLEWDQNIIVGGDDDSFTCLYNFVTHKPIDRSIKDAKEI
uniref:Uncharacterized protein n=1 Tax=Francisella tularensis subsp. novicida PA10-7858 TaxID=1386968 RepID=V5T9N2_FRANO|nr:hypothetical protein [Francisella tularensis]AHB60781.1 hypothetical protein N894_0013 [Francisella tularensis subsp. novicida PA10-7858]